MNLSDSLIFSIFSLFSLHFVRISATSNRIIKCSHETGPRTLIGFLVIECGDEILPTLNTTTLRCENSELFDEMLFGFLFPMNFRNCQMAKLPINVFKNNPSVNMFNISYLGLESLQIDNFVGAKNLQKLIISHNNLKDLPVNIFNETRLDYLNLNFNQIKQIESIGRSGAKGLKTLILANNNITTVTENSFVNLTQLENLSLSFNALRKLTTGVFDNLMNLEHLMMIETKISNIEFMTFAKLTKLESLDLSGNPLKVINFGAHLPVFHSLQLLNINSTQLTELDEFSSALFPNLNFLDLTKNNLNCSHLKSILDTFDLQRVKLGVNPNQKNIQNGNYRGIACHPVKSDQRPTANKIVSGDINESHLDSINKVHETMHKVNLLMIFMTVMFIMTVFGMVLYINRIQIIAKLRRGGIGIPRNRFANEDDSNI